MGALRLEQSARMALAAYLHDLGKLAERAAIAVGDETLAVHQQLYCRRHEAGGRQWYSHKHAAYTALALDLLEPHMPALKGVDYTPFGSMHAVDDADNSLVNAAAMHHKPQSFLQWIVATADRAASGFEREAFERYNAAEEGTETGRNHYQARLLSLLEQIRLKDGAGPEITPVGLKYRYPLRPLSPASIFPCPREQCEPADDATAQAEYRALWDGFLAGIADIPASHREQLPLWIDHLDTLWLTFTHAIPAATAFGTRPDVSLYDHSKATAALATALWRYHADLSHDTVAAASGMQSRADWDEKKFLLIQGDFYGVQDFIFASGAETNKRAAKLLRGRSFYVSLLTECAALRVLEALDLPSTSQITNAAGKFLIVAPNTEETQAVLDRLQAEFDGWFLTHALGRSAIGLAAEAASCNDFVSRAPEAGFAALMQRLFAKLEQAKSRQLGLCGNAAPAPVFSDYLDRFRPDLGPCCIDQYAPATHVQDGLPLSDLAADHIRLGEHLTRCSRLLLTRDRLSESPFSLGVPVFGYWIHLTGSEEESGRFGPSARSGVLRRAFDFSLPRDESAPLWNGYARRNINGYVPLFAAQDAQYPEKYRSAEGDLTPGHIKTLNHLACEDRKPVGAEADRWLGINALGTLKGDVDDLGAIFQRGTARPTFAKMAALSRQVNNFFAVYLPWLCSREYPDTYTVFAGGDDFFLIGPWRSQIGLARRLDKEFVRYGAGNPDLHFSAGLHVSKPGLPIAELARQGEAALAKAKAHPGKNAIALFGQVQPWATMDDLLQAGTELESLAGEYNLSTAYVYGLLRLVPMLEALENPENSLWRSQLSYRTWRTLQRQARGKSHAQMLSDQQRLMQALGERGLQQWKGAYRVAIQTYLYQYR